MIHNSFVYGVVELNQLIVELEETYKSFKMIAVVPHNSGLVLYYSFTSVSEGEMK